MERIRQLFIVGAFPIQIWSIISQLYQIGDGKEFFERASYSLTFALFESIGITLILILVYLILIQRWEETRVIVTEGILYLYISLWGMLGQTYFMLNKSNGTFWYRVFNIVGRNGEVFLPLLVGTLILSTFFIIIVVNRSQRVQQLFISLIDRLSILIILYLLLDITGLVVVIMRNV